MFDIEVWFYILWYAKLSLIEIVSALLVSQILNFGSLDLFFGNLLHEFCHACFVLVLEGLFFLLYLTEEVHICDIGGS